MRRPSPKERVLRWNKQNPVGTPVRYRRSFDRHAPEHLGKTTYPAELVDGATPMIWISGEREPIALGLVQSIKAVKKARG